MKTTIPLFKICTKCKIEKDILLFSKDSRAKDGYCFKCKNCAKLYNDDNKEYNRQRNEPNRDKRIEYLRNYHKQNIAKSLEYREKNKDKIMEYREQNRKKMREWQKNHYRKNRVTIIQRTSAYNKTPIGRSIAKNTRHKRRTTTKDGDVTTQQLLELQNNAKVCYWCNCSLKKVKIHIDHYIPLSKGGEHTLSNLVVSCHRCNLTKNAKDPLEFAQSVGRLL